MKVQAAAEAHRGSRDPNNNMRRKLAALKSTRTPAKSEPVKPGAERREEILSAARDLFYSRGFDTGSMRDLALALNFTQAALYYHFKSKNEIFFSVLDTFTDHVLQSLAKSLDAGTDVVGLCSAIRLHVIISRQNKKDVKLLIEDRKLLSANYASVIKRKERKIFDLYRLKIASLTKSGDLRAVSSVVATFAVLASVNGVYQWYNENGPLTIESIADQTLQILLGGLITEKAKKRLPQDLAKLFKS
jgi:TetR/AcrR family transcriptional regulator, cholesterol catabolism regulator